MAYIINNRSIYSRFQGEDNVRSSMLIGKPQVWKKNPIWWEIETDELEDKKSRRNFVGNSIINFNFSEIIEWAGLEVFKGYSSVLGIVLKTVFPENGF